MRRTTIMADESTLRRLKEVAARQGVSLGQVIREALELRLRQRPERPRFIASGESKKPGTDTARRAGQLRFQPRSWR